MTTTQQPAGTGSASADHPGTTTDAGRRGDATAGHPDHATVTGRRPTTDGRVTVRRVALAELVKLRSVRSTTYALLITALSTVAIGAVTAFALVAQPAPPDGATDAATADPTGAALTGVSLAAYVVAALGVLSVTGEYATGTIRGTLAAVPRRAQLVVGKVLALGALTLAVTLPSTLLAFFAAKAVLSTADMSISLTEPGVARAVVGAALYLTVLALFSAGFGWLLRSTAGALAALFGVLVVLPVIGFFLPPDIAGMVVPYLPGNAGTAVMQLTPGGQLGPWAGFAVFVGVASRLGVVVVVVV